ncbi:MAG: hypothetical protein QNK37_07265 [Acidobacteriota bacterium]|nr:hypothetical protein [Acidobacteriota bacterium]
MSNSTPIPDITITSPEGRHDRVFHGSSVPDISLTSPEGRHTALHSNPNVGAQMFNSNFVPKIIVTPPEDRHTSGDDRNPSVPMSAGLLASHIGGRGRAETDPPIDDSPVEGYGGMHPLYYEPTPRLTSSDPSEEMEQQSASPQVVGVDAAPVVESQPESRSDEPRKKLAPAPEWRFGGEEVGQFGATFAASNEGNLNTVNDLTLAAATSHNSAMGRAAEKSGGSIPNPATPGMEFLGEGIEAFYGVKALRGARDVLSSNTSTQAEKDAAARDLKMAKAGLAKNVVSGVKNTAVTLSQSDALHQAGGHASYLDQAAPVFNTVGTAAVPGLSGAMALRQGRQGVKAFNRVRRIGKVEMSEEAKGQEHMLSFKTPDREVPEEGYGMDRIAAYMRKKSKRKATRDAAATAAGTLAVTSLAAPPAAIAAGTISMGLTASAMGKSAWKRGRNFDKREEMARALHWFAHQNSAEKPKAVQNWIEHNQSTEENWNQAEALEQQKAKALQVIEAMVGSERVGPILDDTENGWKLLKEKARSK